MNSGIRVRFAPSPTGYLHIGGARTALFNWLFARKHHGTFILRIEDTDRERSTPEAVATILDGLRWLGLDWDEGPFYQSERLAAHRQLAEQLLAAGHAYKSYETKEELEAMRQAAEAAKQPFVFRGRTLPPEEEAQLTAQGTPYVVRFRVPRTDGAVTFHDLVHGEQTKRYADIEDFALLRSDGSPLYILSNAADDIAERVTHVVRGQDGLANTPKQLLIYRALGVPEPTFAHLPLILDGKRAKLSKRKHGERATVQFYQAQGFIPDAFLNAIALIGWSPGDNREILSREDMIAAFDFAQVSRTNGIFNLPPADQPLADPRQFTDPKALWLNAEYLRTLPLDRLLPMVQAQLETAGLWKPAFATGDGQAWFARTVDVIRERFRTLVDFTTYGRAYFDDTFDIDPEAARKNLRDPRLATWLPELADTLEPLPDWTAEAVEAALRDFAAAREVKAGLFINAARVALTGQSVGPSMFEVFVLIGRERSCARLRATGQRLMAEAPASRDAAATS
ncbi:glutamate--tRNA ligase [Chloracidobacterium aggregatum]|uniref:Glutamate--tRNA ligase n=1 Tax=Chloracidobacterium sp. N TaxID=2821540 RepID=A0ABX8B4R6_9BACT|nr:glutamate--tRNA ligase [Chloracidobacterium aggregatum]QUV85126.1 glutamate--tRNA ligase [Chloracidobacterium sp. 2]QUV88473.1 glutamate--tRNA ligase [Chloracidobacterium sp. S]QUV91395.1 glutamate--tRNA ligase [Chloracidobacterium sp. A]QUV94571.1 glutamate--tRNA ligase [Chloracidobacterium sp. N]QUV97774.1 glutamate--tRNA ligase [Chloracidobacterium sp. E]